MSDDTDVRAHRRPVGSIVRWLATALAMAAWFCYAVLVSAISADGGAQLLVATLGVATAYAAGDARLFWPGAVRTRRLLVAAVVVLFVVWLLVLQRS